MDTIHSLDQTQTPYTDVSSYPLLPGETIIAFEKVPTRIYPEHPSADEQLMRLSRVDSIDKIGSTGPVLASLEMPAETVGNEGDTEYLHLFEAVFGRDSLRTADSLINIYPELTRTTLLTLATFIGIQTNASRHEKWGGIAHEIREANDPIAIRKTREEGWGWPYYRTVDANPEFIKLLCKYIQSDPSRHDFLQETIIDRSGSVRTIENVFESTLQWIGDRRSENPEGLVEFKTLEPGAWKDSRDAYHHADGTIANHQGGIASIEVQVSTYDALLDAASLYESVINNPEAAHPLRSQAEDVRTAILNHFWTDDRGGYFVLGTDRDDNGNLRQLKIRTSNMGHVLNSRLLEGNSLDNIRKRTAVVGNLLSSEMLARAGIRTLASDEVRFRAGAYHNGTVWLWDSHHIAKGMRRHGYFEAAEDIDQRMMDVIETTRIFTEYVRGEQHTIALNEYSIKVWDESLQHINPLEQPSQEVQAWTVAAVREYQAWVQQQKGS